MGYIKKRVRQPMDPEKGKAGDVPGHLRFIRSLECCACLASNHGSTTKVEAHHVRANLPPDEKAGLGEKPSDWFAVALCRDHHGEIHNHGQRTFEARYKITLLDIAADAWRQSPAGIRYRREHEVKK